MPSSSAQPPTEIADFEEFEPRSRVISPEATVRLPFTVNVDESSMETLERFRTSDSPTTKREILRTKEEDMKRVREIHEGGRE